ncbi:MAG: DUF72 domain-containing protein [Flavobacteriales bacterium]|nr:DUF72 domain-containing protein [Flavobacteriales bacterium]
MKFGKVEQPELVDFTMPEDHAETHKVLKTGGGLKEIHVGCAKWNKKDLKGFYPRGTKDELAYYSEHFNSIEMNSTFYNLPSKTQVLKWKEKTPRDFKFFPKITNSISHYKRLSGIDDVLKEYIDSIVLFEEKLGGIFLQMHANFGFQQMEKMRQFLEKVPQSIPLSVEVRHPNWFENHQDSATFFELLEDHNTTNIIVDTAGRRDMMHMRLTNPTAFIRYVGANHHTDYERLDDWVSRIKLWAEQGLEKLHFFVHQNLEEESPLLSAYFIEKLNSSLGINLKVPKLASEPKLF